MTAGEGAEAQAGHRGLFVFLLLLLVWVPIPIGSNRGWSTAILEAGALFLVGIWALRLAYRPFQTPRPVVESRLSLYFLIAWLCVPLAQLVPLPLWLGQAMTGDLHNLYSVVPGAGTPESMPMSLDRGATVSGFLRQCALVAVFFGVLSLVNSRARIRTLLTVIFAVGFAQALYGLILYTGAGELGLWNPGHDRGTVSGTYVNQNHFAGLLEMTIPTGMGLLLMSSGQQESSRGLRGLLRTLASVMMDQRGVILFGLLVMFAALILSTSRGAVGSLAGAILLVVLAAVSRKGKRAFEVRIGLISAVLAVSAALWLGEGQLMTKLETSGLSSNRSDLRELSLELVADSPILGTGVGTYRWVLPPFKDLRFGSGFYEHAHNDYLEILGEQGIIGFLLLAIPLVLVMYKAFSSYRQENDPIINGALFAAMVGCGSLLIHGLVDFNLQIPANAAYFSTLLGIGAVASTLGKRSPS